MIFHAIVLILLTNPVQRADGLRMPLKIPVEIRFDDLDQFFMPMNCSHGTKTYKKDETWRRGHLLYKCGIFGAYKIIGCVTNENKTLKIGETFVEDNVAHQCFNKSGSVFYREIICGLLGQPDCDKLTFNNPIKAEINLPAIDQRKEIPGLYSIVVPTGWKIVDSNGNLLPISHIKISDGKIVAARKRRQVNFDASIPPRSINAKLTLEPLPNQRIVGIGTGSVSLDERQPISSDGTRNYKPATVTGSRSDVNWSGKTMTVNGKRIAVGPGTFTFGNSPQGPIFKRIN